jgi:phosphate:Na+ symporter
MTFDFLVSFFAGLGLFFIGVKGLGANMGQLAGKRLRQWIARSTGNPALAALIGLLSGALTQSTNAVTVILISLTKADLITVGESTPILAWSNVGTAALVMVAAVDIHLFVFALISLVGLCFYLNLDRSARWRPLVSSSFALGTLFLGLELMRNGTHDPAAQEMARGLFTVAAQSPLLALLIGTVFAAIAQSSATVSVIVVAMASAGLLSLEQSSFFVLGASIGSGVATYFIGFRVSGKPRQLALLQALFKILGVGLLLPLFLAESHFGSKFLMNATRELAADPAHQVAIIYLACQIAAVVAQMLFARPLLPLLERLSPPSVEENLSAPRYIYADALSEPDSALALVDREQSRLAGLMPIYLGINDHLDEAERKLGRESAFTVASSLGRTIGLFLNDLTDTGANRDVLERADDRKAFNALLLSIHESLHALGAALVQPFEAEGMRSLAENITQGLGALLQTAEEAARTRDADDLAVLRKLTADRDGLIDALRRRVLVAGQRLSTRDQEHLFTVTGLLEQIIWMLRRYTGFIAAQAGAEAAPEAAKPAPSSAPPAPVLSKTPAAPG